MKTAFLSVIAFAGLESLGLCQQAANSPSTPSASSPVPAPSAASYNPTGYFPGVNLSVAEFGKGSVLNQNYTYPTDAEFEYFQKKGFKIIRMPFKWERIQPQPLGELSAPDLAQIDRCVTKASSLGLVVLLDIHNYAGRQVNGVNMLVGINPELGDKEFNDVWVKLANHYKDNPLVWFGLMNEPHKQTAVMNAETMQTAVNAIRATGAKNRILVPGTSWTGGHSWIKSGNGAALANFKDPGDNFAFEIHQYLDKDSSGTHTEAVPGKGATSLVAFTEWAKQNHFKAFLGEFGWDGNPANLQANTEGDALLSYMDQNRDVWIGYTYWAAGPWWNKYMYSVEPDGLKQGTPVDKNQLQVLQKHQQ
jgi:endoglucanase